MQALSVFAQPGANTRLSRCLINTSHQNDSHSQHVHHVKSSKSSKAFLRSRVGMMPPSKVPTYPRPVSPLNAESLDLEPQDVIYASSYPSSEGDSSTRAAKRRRIQKLGEQYLRGDGLHILSAGLTGPFDNGWKNPWAKQKRDTNRAVAEIPETADKPLKKPQARNLDRAKAKNRKVEDWLRRNSAYSGIQIEDQSSPTPPCARVVDYNVALAKPTVKSMRDESYEPSKRTDPNAETRDEIVEDVRIDRRAWVSPAANADRAEFAALKSTRRVLEVASSSTMLSPFEYKRVSDRAQKHVADRLQGDIGRMAPPATNLPVALPTKGDTKALEEPKSLHGIFSNVESASGAASIPHLVMPSTSIAIPALSTDTSGGSNANLPSAQPQSLAVPAPSTTDLVIDDRLLEQNIEPVEAVEKPTRNADLSETTASPTMRHLNDEERRMTLKEPQTPGLKNKGRTPVKQRADIAGEKASPNTQNMLAAASPFDFSTIKIKKASSYLQQRATPVTASRTRHEKPAKSTSFPQGQRVPSDCSQGSLKTSLKVSKGQSSVATGKENKLVSVAEEETMLNLLSSSQYETPLPTASPKRLKSALKPAEPPISTGPYPSTKGSTSTGIDGGQNALLLDDDRFDLERAIDDLGSFLGTWDAEKEASNLNIET